MWDILTETFNKSTGESYTKKQLQKRIAYVSYKGKKKTEQANIADGDELDYETQVKRAKKAKNLADDICKSADETKRKRLEIEREKVLKLKEIEIKRQELLNL